MALTQAERERLKDSRLKIKSVAASLHHVEADKVPDYKAIQECLEDAEQSIDTALRASERLN
jgi:phage gp36-like protein